jgi:hypothetical protein
MNCAVDCCIAPDWRSGPLGGVLLRRTEYGRGQKSVMRVAHRPRRHSAQYAWHRQSRRGRRGRRNVFLVGRLRRQHGRRSGIRLRRQFCGSSPRDLRRNLIGPLCVRLAAALALALAALMSVGAAARVTRLSVHATRQRGNHSRCDIMAGPPFCRRPDERELISRHRRSTCDDLSGFTACSDPSVRRAAPPHDMLRGQKLTERKCQS